ncbi:hypothetical protein K6V92_10355 [Cupriavidus respiraculi]|uniref:hypothetical protein n=1 Tax=Cupriavidus respiraculi TaxID=195930 RepID=UPI001C97B540|nr:hypothetical protein [Cupriavidus respiraculi]MBY4947019.1 hypothetical protein [Cupriavidus respiraculi]
MTKLQIVGLVLLAWPVWIFFCGILYAATGVWLMAKGDAAAFALMLTGTAALMAGGLLASGDIK